MSKIEVKVFAEGVAEKIKEYLPEEYQNVMCGVMESQKNNGVTRISVNFHMPDSAVSPMVYMEPFYEEICMGKPLDLVLKEIARGAAAVMPGKILPGTFDVLSYDCVKEYLRIGLINTKANRAMLCGCPHVDMEDLSVVCRIEVPQTEHGVKASIKVSNEISAGWGIEKAEIFRKAAENTIKEYPPILMDIEDAAQWLDIGPAPENLLKAEKVPETSFCPMYVMTNQSKSNGASAMLYPEILDRVYELFPEGYYILPSSIHDLMIVPKSACIPPQLLGEMVRDINREQLMREQILSDRIYEYDKEKGKVLLVLESMEKRREAER